MAKINNWLYLHCNEFGSHDSMDVTAGGENVLYRGKSGRQKLWKRIREDIKNSDVWLNATSPEQKKELMKEIREKILYGNPCSINSAITFAQVVELEEA